MKVFLGLNKHPYTESLLPSPPHFEALTRIKVDYLILPEQEFNAKITADLSNQRGEFNVFMASPMRNWAYVTGDWIVPLDPFLNDPKLTDKAWYKLEDFYPSLIAANRWGGTIDLVQVGYHLFDRRMEQEVFPYCKERGIGVIAYGPLCHGLLTGSFTAETQFVAPDWRTGGVAFGQPLFKPENLRRNVAVVERLVREMAVPRQVPASQIALAWVLRNSVISTALVGARNPGEVEQSFVVIDLKLTDAEAVRIEGILRPA